MATWIRRIVSKNKKRFQDGPHGFDLDLAYISPRIIAMGLPAEGKDVLYRNPLPEIARFLRTYHCGHAKVYNLCSEHKYSPEKLLVPLQHYPFDDHQTPALCVVQQFCLDAAAWLAAHPHNVIAVHCKAGKGRTGIMICCLMLYLHLNAPALANLPHGSRASSTAPSSAVSADTDAAAHRTAGGSKPSSAEWSGVLPGLQRLSGGPAPASSCSSSSRSSSSSSVDAGQLASNDAEDDASWHPWLSVEPLQLQQLENPPQAVLDLYAERRTHDGNGVSIPSQRRYVGFFWSVLSHGPKPVGSLPKPRTVQIRQVQITGLPPGAAEQCVVVVEARQSGSTAASATRVFASPVQNASSSSMHALCMGPCTVPPQVHDDTCNVITTPAGDSLTIKLPAASMGLSLLARRSNSIAAAHQQLTAVDAIAAADGGTSGSVSNCCCACLSVGAATASVHPADGSYAGCSHCEAAACDAAAAAAGPPCGVAAAADVDGSCCVAEEDFSELGEQPDCCIVEGDVRILVLRGGVRLFYTWFNTAFLPVGGCHLLRRQQLDKVPKSMPEQLTLTVKYVDMQPHATDQQECESAAEDGCLEAEQTQHQQEQQRVEGVTRIGGSNSQSGAGKVTASQAMQQQQQQAWQCWHHGALDAVESTSSKSSDTRAYTSAAAAAAQCEYQVATSTANRAQGLRQHHHHQQQQQQRQQHGGSVSAPASPQSGSKGKVGRKSSWHHSLPSISSISTSALVWGSSSVHEEEDSPRQDGSRLGVPHFWDWDWNSLAGSAAADSAFCNTAAAACHTASAADASSVAATAAATAQQCQRASTQQQQQQQLRQWHQQQQSKCAITANEHHQSPFALQYLQAVSSQQKSKEPERWQSMEPPHANVFVHGSIIADSSAQIRRNAVQRRQRRALSKTVSDLTLYSRSPAGIELLTVAKRHATAAGATAATGHSKAEHTDTLLVPATAALGGIGGSHSDTPFVKAVASSVKGSSINCRSADSCRVANSQRRSFSSLWQALQPQPQQGATQQHGSSVVAASTALAVPHLDASSNAATADGADDASDGGDVFVADLLSLGWAAEGSQSRRLASAASAPLSAAALDVRDPEPYQGLLEALNWSTDTWRHQGAGFSNSSNFKPQQKVWQQQQRKAHSTGRLSFSSSSSTCSSRAASPMAQHPGPDVIPAPETPQPWDKSGIQGSRYQDATPTLLSPTSLLDLNEEVDGDCVAVAEQRVQRGTEHARCADIPPDLKSESATQARVNSAAAAPCCLDCVFGLHTGPCPAAAAAAAAAATGAVSTCKVAVAVNQPAAVTFEGTSTDQGRACSAGSRGCSSTGMPCRPTTTAAAVPSAACRRAVLQHPAMQPCRATFATPHRSTQAPSSRIAHSAAAVHCNTQQQQQQQSRLAGGGSDTLRPSPRNTSTTTSSISSSSHPALSWYAAEGDVGSSSTSTSSKAMRRTTSSPAESEETLIDATGNLPDASARCVGSLAGHCAAGKEFLPELGSWAGAGSKGATAAAAPVSSLPRAWSTSTASAAAAAAAAARASKSKATLGLAAVTDGSNHSYSSCAGDGGKDEQLQGLLRAQGGRGAGCSSGGLCSRDDVASLVQRWEQIEKAWQRSWWV